MLSKKQEYWNRVPIMGKVVLFAVTVSLSSVMVSDYIGRFTVSTALENHLREILEEKALEFRLDFSRYVKAHTQTAKIFVARNDLVSYIEDERWKGSDKDFDVKNHRETPPWFPPRTILRTFANPRHAVLLDREGQVRETYSRWRRELPSLLKKPSKRLLQLTNDVSYLTSIDNAPYLVTSEKVKDSEGRVIGIMVLSSPFDQEFVIASQGYSTRKFIVALVSDEPHRIVVSSSPEVIRINQSLKELEKDFIIIKQEFFEYGTSDMTFKFVAFLPKTEIDTIMAPILRQNRLQNFLQALLYIGCFSLILFYITRRVMMMTGRIELFSKENLGSYSKEPVSGDEIHHLEKRFQLLTEEVTTANDEVKLKAEELVNSQAQLIQAEKLTAMGQMAGGLAHELNSPLAGLLPMIERYRDKAAEDTEEYKELTMMLSACNHMAKIVKDFGSFSRASKGKFSMLNLNDVIEDTLSFSATRMKQRKIKVVKGFKQHLPLVNGAKTELQQVVLNMMTNAMDSMPDGGNFTILTSCNGSKVVMEFIDSGEGIDGEELDKIFDPFYTTKGPGKGTGLGLSLSYGIVEKHGGTITVESSPDEGTRFSVILPAAGQTAT